MRVFYAVELKRSQTQTRYQLYELKDGGLETVWPDDPKHPALLPNQVHLEKRNAGEELPAFHFRVGGIGNDRQRDLAEALANHFGKPVSIRLLDGWITPEERTALGV